MTNNKYNLTIIPNYSKRVSQFQGNGIYSQYVAGCFNSGKFFRVYALFDVFYLAVGDAPERIVEVDREPVDNGDFISHIRIAKTFMKYVNILLDRYLENIENELPITPIRTI